MENNKRDFMMNRPVAAKANQYKDVYGSQNRSTRTAVSAALSVIVFILMMIAVFTGNRFMMLVFIPLFALLMISFAVGRRADRQNAPVEPGDESEALFRDHEI